VFDPQGQFGDGATAAAAPARPAFGAVEPAHEGSVRGILGSGRAPEVLWTGPLYGYSGYAKGNREILHRVASSMRVCAVSALMCEHPDPYEQAQVDLYSRVAISPGAPMVRFFGPREEPADDRRFKILYTMMETELIHRDMVGLINAHYDECWTPTLWNARAFEKSGVRIPMHVMPLGVNPLIYKPGPKMTLPAARLLTTERAGTIETPSGFLFTYVFLPSFRKGLDVLLPAFEEAFKNDPEAGLVLAVTHNPMKDEFLDTLRPDLRARVWVLNGFFTEYEMAAIYRSCDAYVSTSRGEGWNLPMCEAACCGLPVIVPANTAHLDLVDHESGYLIETEGTAVWEQGQQVSPWYDGVPFSKMENRSRTHLTKLLREVKGDYLTAVGKTQKLAGMLNTKYTWDQAARHVGARLMDIQG